MGFSALEVDDLKLNTAPMWAFHMHDWRWKPTPLYDYCLWYVAGGEGEVYWNKWLYPLSEGTLIIWRPGEVPVIKRDFVVSIRLFSCHFEHSRLPANWFDFPRPLKIANWTYFVELAYRCQELWWRDTVDSKLEAKRNFLSMLYLIQEETQTTFSVVDDEVESVAALLRSRFEGSWTLDQLANRAELSRSQLVRRFRARYGQAPMQYLNLARLEASRRMLIETDWSLKEIAKECGFSDGAHFSNAFKKQFGITPLAFRKR